MIGDIKGKGELFIIEFLNEEENSLKLYYCESGVFFTSDKKQAKHFDRFSDAWIKGMNLIENEQVPFKYFDVMRHGSR